MKECSPHLEPFTTGPSPAKAPFEPICKAFLKHLTQVFLLALGSGKRHSEIHAWLYKSIRHPENWSQVSLYP